MKRYNELTKNDKTEALTFIQMHYECGQGCYLELCAMSAYVCEDISNRQREWFEGLLNEEVKLRGLVNRVSLWPIGDRQARIDWIDEQIKLVEDEEI